MECGLLLLLESVSELAVCLLFSSDSLLLVGTLAVIFAACCLSSLVMVTDCSDRQHTLLLSVILACAIRVVLVLIFVFTVFGLTT